MNLRTLRILPIAFALGLATLFTLPQSRAGLLEDILAMATAARDRAIEARNNAANARDRATEARNNAAAARDTAVEIRETMRAGLSALSNEVQDAIEEAIVDLQREIQEEMDGRDAYVQSGAAEPFRQDLITMLHRVEALINALYDLVRLEETEVDFSRFVTAIEALPAPALYPLYRALVVELNLFQAGGLLDQLDQAVSDVQLVAMLFVEPAGAGDGEFLDGELLSCTAVIENYAALKKAATGLTLLGGSLKLTGTVLKAAGQTSIKKSGAVWGWVGVTIENNRTMKVGIALSGAADFLSAVSGAIGTQLRHCAGVAIQDEARARDLLILENQAEILKNQRQILKLLKLESGEAGMLP